jgi:hypothetical protein
MTVSGRGAANKRESPHAAAESTMAVQAFAGYVVYRGQLSGSVFRHHNRVGTDKKCVVELEDASQPVRRSSVFSAHRMVKTSKMESAQGKPHLVGGLHH